MNYTNQLIVFSKNRACQLELLLYSLSLNSNDLFDNIIVLYTYDLDYKSGYDKVIKRYPLVKFHLEQEFKVDLISYLDDEHEYTTFMVDDAVLFSPLLVNKDIILSKITNDVICFSLRLGNNCNYSHPADLNYTLGKHSIVDEFISFDYMDQEYGDFRYPLSTDGHIFKTKLLRNMLQYNTFKNPNTLEISLQIFIGSNLIPKIVYSFIKSKLVSIPANLVNTSCINRHGLEYFISEKDLEAKFVAGNLIDYHKLDFTTINGPHKEIKYTFKKI
jgi:hypothetical protein